ncbi:fructosamine kinase family protein [Rhodovulum sulfidophilum]|uniref:fructosamine kinase family protein n=1 Tax=Rhodovulum sulfidophilum TaxID=35806 RepID=UPI0009515096|nr:fructosamine kinase family protein [Rhodovulum sulfidophilum]OLS51445.1 aminoglycoside phosphotransferase [Rhodovulum sulfidophilum]
MAERAALEALAGAAIARRRSLSGGDLSEVIRVDLEDGRRMVAKAGPRVAAEARMLRAIARAGVPAPAVIAEGGGWLLIEHLDECAASGPGWAALGTALLRLHGTTGAAYGWDEDHGFGPAAIPNAACADWPDFWAARRLLAWPEALPAEIARRVETLAARLDGLIPRHPPAALLHGDLWTGNVLFTAEEAALIDPACYHGDAEVDLAMLELFGTPGPAFRERYGAPAPDWPARRAVYQLWPALVHLRLFGSGYRGLVERCLATLGA